MSDDIPLELQADIIKRLSVKSLLQFRSVSKTWKSLIASSHFIKDYPTQLQHLFVTYDDLLGYEQKYVSFVDDDDASFPKHKVSVALPQLFNMLENPRIIGCSHGLLCLYKVSSSGGHVAAIWNISIRKAVAVNVPNIGKGIYDTVLGFGVCRETTDPKIVKVTYVTRHKRIDTESVSCIPHQVEVFTLSTGAWRSSYGNLPHKSIRFSQFNGVVIDGVFYWLATDWITTDGELRSYNLIISFDITSEEFREVTLPDSLAHSSIFNSLIFKLRESLIAMGRVAVNPVFSVWMMEDGVSKSFTKLFTFDVNKPVVSVWGFRKSGEPILEIIEDDDSRQLVVYEPYSKHIENLGIDGIKFVNSVYPYMETLLLLDQPNFIVYNEVEAL